MSIRSTILPKVTLVSTITNNPLLLAPAAIHALNRANVVLYETPAQSALLDFVPTEAKKVFVGGLGLTQQQLNTLLVDYALTHGQVVFLKSNDRALWRKNPHELQLPNALNIETAFVPNVAGIFPTREKTIAHGQVRQLILLENYLLN